MTYFSSDTSADYPSLELLIDGEWIGPASRETLAVHNPATGVVLSQLPVAKPADVARAIDAATRAFSVWRGWTAYARGEVLLSIANALRDSTASLSTILTLEQGKPLREAAAEIAATADAFEWMAEQGKHIYGRIVPSRRENIEQAVVPEPVGPVAAITPWNFPAVLTGRKIAGALAAGCTVVAKPAEETPGIMVAIARLCQQAGLPPGALNLLYGEPSQISRQLIDDPRVKQISFTGSVEVGKHLSTLAGAAMKKITLELGGHAPVVICADADSAQVAAAAVVAKFRNAGQVCHCPTRFFIHETRYDEFVGAFAAHARQLQIGNGLHPRTQIGPVANKRRVAALHTLCEDAMRSGAKVLCGGEPLAMTGAEANGFWWPPTLLSRPGADCRAMNEEPFGPIALTVPFDSLDTAIAAANNTDYGLSAYGFTQSLHVAQRLKRELQAGAVAINTFAMAPPELPFAGVKQSGLGEEMGVEGLMSHFNAKAILTAIC